MPPVFLPTAPSRNSTSPAIAVAAATADRQAEAGHLAGRLGLPVAAVTTERFDFLLVCTTQRLELRQIVSATAKTVGPGPVYAEFTGGPLDYRRRHGGGRAQPLARAVGLKQGRNPAVIDATGGLGRDAFVLAHLGCNVLLIERSPIIAALLADGLHRAAADPAVGDIAGRMQLLVGDSLNLLPDISRAGKTAVIYLDPMYPSRDKSALVKKEMRILRAIAGADQDAAALLRTALDCAAHRVVVKRPRRAPLLAPAIPPTMSIMSKNNRFDVYVTNLN